MKPDKIRIGRIDFTNVWPLFHHFPEELAEQAEFVKQVPTGLNAGMRAGQIDMGPISSFAYGESFEDYMLYPDFSVSALGAVKSILLFHKQPLDQVANGRIALPTTSASSVNLLKILIEKFYGGKPDYFSAPPALDDMMRSADAALLIGDHAIRASWRKEEYIVTDLGELWRKHTGRWMTFAVWAIRKEVIASHPSLVLQIQQAFEQSKRLSLAHPESMIETAVRTIGGTSEYWRAYFSNLCYDFGSGQREGLSLYYRYCYEMGLLRKEAPLQIWTDHSVTR